MLPGPARLGAMVVRLGTSGRRIVEDDGGCGWKRSIALRVDEPRVDLPHAVVLVLAGAEIALEVPAHLIRRAFGSVIQAQAREGRRSTIVPSGRPEMLERRAFTHERLR